MKAAKQIATFKRLRQEPLWSLLASTNAPVTLGIIKTFLVDNEKKVPESILHERIGRELEELRAEGMVLPQTAQAYVADWLASGYLQRYFPPGSAEEEYEISAAAAGAIRFITGLIDKRTSATESRLAVVIQQLIGLVEETDDNPQTRINLLLNERIRIDRELEEIKAGKVKTLDSNQAMERISEIILLTRDLVSDFRQVRDDFEVLNRDLRVKLMEESDSRGTVLESLFAGVDVISQTEAGRTFAAFWRLLTDPEQNKSLDEAIETILGRGFALHLQPAEKLFLRRLTRTLLEQGGAVHEVMQNLARSLKQFVQSREYMEQRLINRLLLEASQAALALKNVVNTAEDLEYELPLTGCKMSSISQWKLYDPSAATVDGTVTTAGEACISLDTVGQLVAQSEIDFRTLAQNIRDCLADHSSVSIAQVMERFPAKQGLGSVIGYVALGSKHGIVLQETESVSWFGGDEKARAARIPLIYFSQQGAESIGRFN